jgi:hypothetical protein
MLMNSCQSCDQEVNRVVVQNVRGAPSLLFTPDLVLRFVTATAVVQGTEQIQYRSKVLFFLMKYVDGVTAFTLLDAMEWDRSGRMKAIIVKMMDEIDSMASRASTLHRLAKAYETDSLYWAAGQRQREEESAQQPTQAG